MRDRMEGSAATNDGAGAPEGPGRPRRDVGVLARRAVQAVSLGAFLWLLLRTDLSPARPGDADALPLPVRVFFDMNPLAAVSTLLSSGVLYRGLVLALAVVAATMLLGRVFCGWFCPLGTLQQIAGLRRDAAARRDRNRYGRGRRVKYGVLLACLGAAVAGSAAGMLLDPISIAFRGVALGVLPAGGRAARDVMEAAYDAGPPASYVGDGFRYLFAEGYLPFRDASFQSALAIAGILILVLGLARLRPRFFCRFVCPLGALLGLLSRWSLPSLRKDPDRCNGCRKCLDHCQGADGPEAGVPWRKAECHLCLNCTASCPEKALAFRLGLEPAVAGADARRRTLLAAFASGAAAVPLMRISPLHGAAPDPRRIRPPGALPEDRFLARCIRCGECMKVCPTNALQPAVTEAGIEGFWTPVLVPRIGDCQPGCTLCWQVCPTGAIRRFTDERKLGADGRPPLRIGTARIDRGACLPWANGVQCIVCEEFCPTSPKAIRLEIGPTPDAPRLPVVDLERCNGCGACEKVCPLVPAPAIVVTAAGETRAEERRLIPR